MNDDAQLAASALQALRGPSDIVDALDPAAVSRPGLYALHGAAKTWRELQLGGPPDNRPLYVGKSESSLAVRDIRGHFGRRTRGVQSPTGASTLRRSIAALLAPVRGYRGLPRNPSKPSHFANFGLSDAHDRDLSQWMERNLRISVWPHDDVRVLDATETAVLRELAPPLNLSKVVTPWSDSVKESRRRMADQARAWKAHPN